MSETVRSVVVLVLLAGALTIEGIAVIGQYRFHYSLNRIHAAGMGDTLGVALALLAGAVHYGLSMNSLKLLFVVMLMWMTSPLATHMVGQMVELTDDKLKKEAREWKS